MTQGTRRPIDLVLDLLQGVRKQGKGWTARCPAHDDKRNSLSIAEGADGKVLLYCHAGCPIEAITAALQLRPEQLWPEGDGSGSNGTGRGGKTAKGKGKEKKKLDLVPAGSYLVRIAKIEEKDEKLGPRWKIALLISAGEHRDSWVFDNWSWSGPGLSHTKAALEAVGFDCRGEVDVEPLMVQGRTCTVEVEVEPGKDGKLFNSVPFGAYSPPTEITYPYRDREGTLLYQVVRLTPKAFYQRQPNGSGGWIYTLGDVPRVPYRMPEILSTPPSERVWIVEGEKDADRLAALGLCSSTSPQGAGKWNKLQPQAVGETFGGRKVIVIPDNDDPGRAHAAEVATSLSSIAEEVRVLELPGLPEKGDVSDWLDADPSHGPAELQALADRAPTWSSTPSSDEPGILTNYTTEEIEVGGKVKTVYRKLPLRDILRSITVLFGGWPRRLGQELFADQGDGEIQFLRNEAELFSYFHGAAVVKWKDGGEDVEGANYVTRRELLAALSSSVPLIEEISDVPLEPEPPRVYVTARFAKEGASEFKALDAFVQMFKPATPADEALIFALTLTPFWGGSPGARPFFLVTGRDSVGIQATGKTTLAELVGLIAGGVFRLNVGRQKYEDSPAKQLVSDEALRHRVVLVDNLSGYFDSNDLAELITAREIHGRPAHGHQRSRANRITWIGTSVSPELSGDLASRAMVVQIDPPDKGASRAFREEADALVLGQRGQLILDILTALRGAKRTLTGPSSRFPSWDREVLATHPFANQALESLTARQISTDAGLEGVGLFLEELRDAGLREHKTEWRPRDLVEVWKRANNQDLPASWVARRLRECEQAGKLPGWIRPKWRGKHGSPWVVSLSSADDAMGDSTTGMVVERGSMGNHRGSIFETGENGTNNGNGLS